MAIPPYNFSQPPKDNSSLREAYFTGRRDGYKLGLTEGRRKVGTTAWYVMVIITLVMGAIIGEAMTILQ